MFQTKYNKFTDENTRKKQKNKNKNKNRTKKNNKQYKIKSNYVEKCLIRSSIIIKLFISFFITFMNIHTYIYYFSFPCRI